MEREKDVSEQVIELGVASEATKGPWGPFLDEILMQGRPGLSD